MGVRYVHIHHIGVVICTRTSYRMVIYKFHFVYLMKELIEYLKKMSMYQINTVRSCVNCEYGDQAAIKHNEESNARMKWGDMKPVCRFAFKIDWNQDDLSLICPKFIAIS